MENTSNQETSLQPIAEVSDEISLIKKSLNNIREEIRDNPYVREAVKVLPVQGYRSAIGSYWNAVGIVREDTILKSRIKEPGKITRLRNLGNVLLDKPNLRSDLKGFLELLVDDTKTSEFFRKLGS